MERFEPGNLMSEPLLYHFVKSVKLKAIILWKLGYIYACTL